MESLSAAMIEAAKEITITVLREDKDLLNRGVRVGAEEALREDIRRVPELYRAIYAEIRASFQSPVKAAEKAANVN